MSNESNNPAESPSAKNPSTSGSFSGTVDGVNPESPSVNPSSATSGSDFFSSILQRKFGSRDLRSFGSSSSLGSLESASSRGGTAELSDEAGDAVTKAKERMGLLRRDVTPLDMFRTIDKKLVEDLVLVENKNSSSRRYAGIDNTCQLALNRLGVDLNKTCQYADAMVDDIQNHTQAIRDLEDGAARLRAEYNRYLESIAREKMQLDSSSDLLNERIRAKDDLANKYALAEFIQENPEPLKHANLDDARSYVGLQSIEQVRLLNQHDCQKKLRLLKRLGWNKSEYMVKVFDGLLLVKPREGTAEVLHDFLIAYLYLAPDDAMQEAARVLHRNSIQPTTELSASKLAAILEDEEGDDPDTLAKKRKARELVEAIVSPNKKRRIN